MDNETEKLVPLGSDALLDALGATLQTNGREIVNRMREIAALNPCDPKSGWDGVMFCRAAIAMLSEASNDQVVASAAKDARPD